MAGLSAASEENQGGKFFAMTTGRVLVRFSPIRREVLVMMHILDFN